MQQDHLGHRSGGLDHLLWGAGKTGKFRGNARAFGCFCVAVRGDN